jgi:hypothetical protein
MRGSRRNLIATADLKHALIIGISGINCQSASQDEVVIRILAVVMPRNDVTGRQCEDARLDHSMQAGQPPVGRNQELPPLSLTRQLGPKHSRPGQCSNLYPGGTRSRHVQSN